MPDLILHLDDLGDGAAEATGPKAFALARMARLGLPVPPGFCVTGAAYRSHVESTFGNGLDGTLADLAQEGERDRRGEVLAGLRAAIRSAPLSGPLEAALTSAWRELVDLAGAPSVAVRSSSTAEDLPDQSFAGQHDSFLGVVDLSGCLLAVRRCWASLWTERAYEYRARNGIGHRAVDMAVVVQQLVPADVATDMTTFTNDPGPVEAHRDRLARAIAELSQLP